MKILVVDDMGYFRYNLARTLEHHGHDVSVADGGPNALQQLDTDRNFDVVITDLVMGDMDGVELFLQAKALVDDRGNVRIPPFILLTTAKAGRPGTTAKLEGRLQAAKAIGFAGVLYKPLDADELHRVLRTLISSTPSETTVLPALLEQLHTATNAAVRLGNVEVAQRIVDRLETNVQMLNEFIASQEPITAV